MQYKASRTNVVNDSDVRCTVPFGCKLPALFRRVEPSLASRNVASTHPLPSKRYSTFLIIYQELDNALTTKSLPLFLKLQRILLRNLLLMMLLMM